MQEKRRLGVSVDENLLLTLYNENYYNRSSPILRLILPVIGGILIARALTRSRTTSSVKIPGNIFYDGGNYINSIGTQIITSNGLDKDSFKAFK